VVILACGSGLNEVFDSFGERRYIRRWFQRALVVGRFANRPTNRELRCGGFVDRELRAANRQFRDGPAAVTE
jgi:hypothetical protein